MTKIDGIENFENTKAFIGVSPKEKDKGLDFGEVMKNTIDNLNAVSKKAGSMSDSLAAGENVELHDVMMAMQEADVTMRLTMQIRNKVLEAYKEVIHMPI